MRKKCENCGSKNYSVIKSNRHFDFSIRQHYVDTLFGCENCGHEWLETSRE